MQRLYDDAENRAADIAQLQQIAAGYRSRERFLTELTLEPPEATSGDARATQLDEDYTILSTIHSAKGGEWKIVRVLNVVEGCIPSAKATRTSEEIEEELRLLHVAMTRTKDELDLIVPQRLFMYQQKDMIAAREFQDVAVYPEIYSSRIRAKALEGAAKRSDLRIAVAFEKNRCCRER